MRFYCFDDDPYHDQPHLTGGRAAASGDASVGLDFLGNHISDLYHSLQLVGLKRKSDEPQGVSKGYRFSDDEPVRYAVKGFDQIQKGLSIVGVV